MKQIQIILLMLFCAFTGFNAAGQANANLNILTLNSGQVNQGAVVDLQVSVGNTGPVSSIGVNKVRAQISIPIAIATALPTAQQTGLPAGWIVLTNTGNAITVCNGTDVIPVGEQRQIFIKIQGTAVGGPSTINGSLSFGPGSGVCTGPGSLSGDNTADNTSTSSITVLPAPACNLALTATAGIISCNGGSTSLTATATRAAGAVEYSLNGGTFQASNVFTVTAAGSPYTVTARETANTSCTATASAVTVTQPTAITASATAGTISCNGGTTTLTTTASGGTAPLQYSLNGGNYQPGNTFTVNAAGSPYIVSVKDANLCTVTTNSVTINQPSPIIASAAAGTINCNAGNTSLTVTASGGTAPLQYGLNGGNYQVGNTFTVNAAGSPYIVSVKDANLCTVTINSVTVTQPTQLTATATSTPVSTIGGSDGTATAVPAGGTSPYTYSWTPGGQTTVTASGLTAGSYTVTVTDSKGCTTTATTTVGSPACNVTASASAGTIACNGGTTSLTVTATGAAAPVQYSLNGGTFQSANTFTVGAGTYTVSVKDANNCTATTASVGVTAPTAISASASAGTINCFGGTTTLTVTATGGTAPLQYSLNGGAYQSGNTFTINVAGSPYTVTVRDANLCTQTTSQVTVTQPTQLTATATSTAVTTTGGSDGTATAVPVGGTSPYTYSWTPGGQTTVTANGLTGGSYTVTITDSKGCITTVTATVGSPACNVTASAVTGTAIQCNAGITTLTVTATGAAAPVQYSLNGGAFQSGNVFTVGVGTYTVTVKDANNCTATTSAVTITQPTAVVVSASAQPIALPGGTTTVTINATGGTAPYTGTGSFVRSAGTYTFTVTDAHGCNGSTTLTLSDPVAGNANASLNILTLNSGQVNLGAVVDLQVSVGNTGPSFIGVNKVRAQISIPIAIATALTNAQQTGLPTGWIILTNTGGTITVCNGTDQIPSGQQRQLFIKIQGTAAGGPSTINGSLSFGPGSGVCTGPGSLPGDNTADNTSTSSITVISTCSLGVTASAGTILCNGGTTTLTATATGAAGAVEYSLNGGAFQAGNTFTVNAAGSPYTITAREVATPACTATATPVTVTQPTALVASSVTGIISCNGGTATVVVSATGGTAPYTGTGSFNAAAGAYSYTVTDVNGCTSITTGNINQPALIVVTAANTTIACAGGSSTVTVSATGGTAPYTGTGTFSQLAGTTVYTVTDANGCTGSISKTITQPTIITASASAGTINCNGGTTTLTVTASGGTAPLQYSLNGGNYQAGNTFTVNATGSPYIVSVKDANLCTVTTNSVTVNQPTQLTATATSTPVTTIGGSDGTATATPAGGTSPYSYSWNSTPVQTTATATGLTAGTYTVTVTDFKGCITIATTTVGSPTVGAPLAATFVKTNLSACGGSNDGSITITATGGTAPYTYSWTGETGSNHTPFTAGNVSSLTGLNYGFYNVTVTDAASHSVTISNIHIEFAFVVFVTATGSNTSSCGNTGSITLYGNSGVQPYTYSIDGTIFQVSNTFPNLAAATYTGYVKDAAGCVSTKPGIVISSAAPIIVSTFARAATSCANDGSIEVYRTGGIPPYTYSINGTIFQPGNIFTGLAAGTYTAIVKDSKGCTATQTAIVAQGAAITASASKNNTSSCINNGTIQVSATGGVAPYTYSINGATFQASNSFILLGVGSYTVIVKDSKGCTGTVNVSIATNPITVTASVVNASSCAATNGFIQLFRTGGFGPYMYSIDGSAYQASPVFSNLLHGTYIGYVKDSRTCVGMITNIVVGPGGCVGSLVASATKDNGSASVKILQTEQSYLNVQAYPNPSVTTFTLVLEGFNSKEKVSISVTDLLGRVVYQTEGTGKFQYEFGKNFIAGMYNVQVIQGNERKNLKIVKE